MGFNSDFICFNSNLIGFDDDLYIYWYLMGSNCDLMVVNGD